MKILEERALKKPRETKEKKTMKYNVPLKEHDLKRLQATQLSLMLGECKDKVDDALTWVPRGDIQSDPVSKKKVLVVCFVVLFVVCFVCCGFGAFLSKKQEAKQAKQGSKKAKQAKQGGRRKTEGEQKNVVCKSVAFKSVSCSKILECMTPSPFPFSLSLSRL